MANLNRLSSEGVTIDQISALGAEDRERVKQAVRGGALRVHTPHKPPAGFPDPEPTVLQVPDALRDLIRGDTPPLQTDMGTPEKHQPSTAAAVQKADFASWGVDVGDSDNNDTAIMKWNIEQYGVADVSSLTDDQMSALQSTRAVEQKAAQEEESRLLHFLTNRQGGANDVSWGSDDALLFSGADEVEDAVFATEQSPPPEQTKERPHGYDASQPYPSALVDSQHLTSHRSHTSSTTDAWYTSEPSRGRDNDTVAVNREEEDDAPDFLDSAADGTAAATGVTVDDGPGFDLSAGVLAVQRTAWRSSEAARYGEQFNSPVSSGPRFKPDVTNQQTVDENSPGLWAVTEASVSGSFGANGAPSFDDERDEHGRKVQYDSFPSLEVTEHDGKHAVPEPASRPASTLESIGQWFGGVGGMFGERPPSSTSARSRTESVGMVQDDAPVKEGFMCPICMTNCSNAAELIECYERCSALAESTEGTTGGHAEEQQQQQADSLDPMLEQASHEPGSATSPRRSNDASHAWANAIPTKELEIRRTSSPFERRSTPLAAGVSESTPTSSARQVSPAKTMLSPRGNAMVSPSERREMYCLRCMEPKTTVTDAFCHGCGQAHMNRMMVQEVQLRLRKSTFGFGLGFKDHYVHKVQPGSTAEVSGLRVGDTIVRVNNHSVVEMPDVEVLTLIKTTDKTLFLVVRRVLPTRPAFGSDDDTPFEISPRQNPFSPSPDNGATKAEDEGPQSPTLDFVTEAPPVDEDEVSQSVRDSSYVKMMRERLEGYEAKLTERDSTIKALHSEKTRLADELSAVMQQGDSEPAVPESNGGADSSTLSMLDDMLPRLPTVSPTDYTLQNLCWSMGKHISAARIAAAPLNLIAAELPDRVTAAIDAEVEFQSAATNQARVSQSIDPDGETTGQEQLAMSKASSRVISASDGKQQAEQRLAETLQEVQTTVDHVSKTARLAEHHIEKFAALLEEMPQLGAISISNEDDEVTW